jgi:hypothetical protein
MLHGEFPPVTTNNLELGILSGILSRFAKMGADDAMLCFNWNVKAVEARISRNGIVRALQ